MIFPEECEWVTYGVPNGAVITAEGERFTWQKVQWMLYSDRFGDLTGYIN